MYCQKRCQSPLNVLHWISNLEQQWRSTKMLSSYSALLESHPLQTKAITTSCFNGLQEVIALKATGESVAKGSKKAIQMALYGDSYTKLG